MTRYNPLTISKKNFKKIFQIKNIDYLCDMTITHDLKMVKRTIPFEGVKQLAITLLDISESDSREPFRHFDIHMVQEELNKFWGELKQYDKLITPYEVGKEISYPFDMISVNGITVTLHRYEQQ